MNINPQPPLSGIPPAPQPALAPSGDICACIDAILATLLLWAGRLGFFGRRITREIEAIAGALRALSTLFARFAAGQLPLPQAPRTPAASPPAHPDSTPSRAAAPPAPSPPEPARRTAPPSASPRPRTPPVSQRPVQPGPPAPPHAPPHAPSGTRPTTAIYASHPLVTAPPPSKIPDFRTPYTDTFILLRYRIKIATPSRPPANPLLSPP